MKEICIERTEHTQNRSIQYPLPALYLTEATFYEIKIRFTIPYPVDIVKKKKLKNQFVITIVHVQTDN